MRLGVSLKSGHEVDDPRDAARRMIERTRAAWEAGLDSLFVGDHHVTGRPYMQNSPILGRLLAEWGDRPSGALYLLPLWNPVLLAEQTATLASIAGGRFIMQCAIGAGDEQFAGMGADISRRPSLFESSLSVVRRLWAGETVDDETWGIRGARISPQPPEPIEVWIGGHAPAALDRAARLGDVWLAGPDALDADAARMLEAYRERCEAHGRSPGAVAIRRDVYVGASDDDAASVAEPILSAGYRGFDPAATITGSAETVAERIRALGDLGFTDVIVRHLTDDQEKVLASLDRLAGVRERLS